MSDNMFTIQAIGTVRSPHASPKGAPIQPEMARDVAGTVEIFPEFVPGLADLDGFSHLVLIYVFHLCTATSLEVVPYLDRNTRGVFSTRAPVRPNHLGISVVRLERVDGGTLHILDVDLVDGTPLVDIKPWVPRFDAPVDEVRTGWIGETHDEDAPVLADGRFHED